MKKILFVLFLVTSFNLFSQENSKEETLRAITNLERAKNGLNTVDQSSYYQEVNKYVETLSKPDTTKESINGVITKLNTHFFFPTENIMIHYGAIITDIHNNNADMTLFDQIESKVPITLFSDNNIDTVLFKEWEYKCKGKKILFIYIISFLRS
jgi:hypothetical protein